MVKIKVLSLCDGMSCGYLALKKLGIDFEYHAVEIDKYARQTSDHNFKDIIRIENDVTKITKDMVGHYDLVMFGSPCQSVSFSGKGEGLSGSSGLLIDCLKILSWAKEINPNVKYLIENVKMKKSFLEEFNKLIGHKGTLINSSLVSAQNRERYYWTNLKDKIQQPKDLGIILATMLENGVVDRDKSYCIDASYFKGGNLKTYFEKARRQLVFNYSSSGRGNGVVVGKFSDALKSLTLPASGYSNRGFTGVFEDFTFRKLTVRECARLQTIPEWYDFPVSKTQAYKQIGNGWTVDVIVHILKELGV